MVCKEHGNTQWCVTDDAFLDEPVILDVRAVMCCEPGPGAINDSLLCNVIFTCSLQPIKALHSICDDWCLK